MIIVTNIRIKAIVTKAAPPCPAIVQHVGGLNGILRSPLLLSIPKPSADCARVRRDTTNKALRNDSPSNSSLNVCTNQPICGRLVKRRASQGGDAPCALSSTRSCSGSCSSTSGSCRCFASPGTGPPGLDYDFLPRGWTIASEEVCQWSIERVCGAVHTSVTMIGMFGKFGSIVFSM